MSNLPQAMMITNGHLRAGIGSQHVSEHMMTWITGIMAESE